MLVPERAIDDLRLASFPLLELDDTQAQEDALVPITHPPFGREGLLPASFFRPIAFNLYDVDSAASEINRTLTGSGHVRAVLKGHLGPHGARLGSSIMQELALHAGHNRSANCAVTTVRIALDNDDGGRVFASIWDDGQRYESTEIMEATLKEDEWGVLGADPSNRKPLPEDSPPFVTHAIRTATQGFGGTVRLLSGGMGVKVGYDENRGEFGFHRYSRDPISGNLVVIELPSISTRSSVGATA
jgi:hypothetical protein